MKRTTLILEEGCLDSVKNLARKENRTLSEVVNEFPSFEMGEARVHLSDRDALEAAMED